MVTRTSSTCTLLPRWRGFNLLGMYQSHSNCLWSEDDFRWIRDWGFNFVRLPLCYKLWTGNDGTWSVNEAALNHLDEAIYLGAAYGLHVCLSFHHAPGYCVAGARETSCLWLDDTALQAFCFHWELLARRYQDISAESLSFNLVNEPPPPGMLGITRTRYKEIVQLSTEVIRQHNPERVVIADGLSWGREACPELAETSVAQGCRGYAPMGVSHYGAEWVCGDLFPPPSWPGGWEPTKIWDRSDLQNYFEPWIALTRRGVGVHCGEVGAFNQTPHHVVLAWMTDLLGILKNANIGYALWNLRGEFGILDSRRSDVHYTSWHGHQLDEEYLKLLQEM